VLRRLNKRMETVGMRRDGKTFPIELTIVSSTDQNELFFTATVRDITEKKLIEAEKAGLLTRYRRLSVDLERQKMALDQHAVVSIMNADESIVYANDKLVETSGFSRDELIGKKYYQLRRQLDPVVYADLRASLAAGRVWHGELVMRRRNGGSYWATCTLVPVPGDDGRPRQWINIETDISALRETEIALQDARLRELETGTRIQQSLLSANPSQQRPGLWLSAYNQASKGVDGDFLDVIRIGEHCVDILAGDVMGKGVPAALMGAATKLQFSRSIAELLTLREPGEELPQPSAIVASVHQAMTPHLQTLEAFVTLVYIRIDSLRNVMTWIGCGHEETMVLRGHGGFELLPNQHPPLGILEHQDFSQDETPLAFGDAVFLCSDGLTDAVVSDGERVGRDALNQAVKQVVRAHPAPAAALHSLRRQVLHDEVQVVDDITMVLLMRTAVHDFGTRCELPIALGSLREFREFVAAHALRLGLPEDAAAMFVVAAVEVFTNIIRHAQGLLPGAPVELFVHDTAEAFTLDIVHLGAAFTPPDEVEVTDLSAFPEGGFGLTIIRSSCDCVEYLHHQGVNTVRMTRWLTPAS
jgi:phosphoserine phosphatase RsbU/P